MGRFSLNTVYFKHNDAETGVNYCEHFMDVAD